MPPSFQEDLINKIPRPCAACQAGLYLSQSAGGVGAAGGQDDQGFAGGHFVKKIGGKAVVMQRKCDIAQVSWFQRLKYEN